MHQGNLPVQKGASSSYVEQGWDALSDDQLLQVQWSTDDPLALPNIQSNIPADLGEFQIELAYDLSPYDTPVSSFDDSTSEIVDAISWCN